MNITLPSKERRAAQGSLSGPAALAPRQKDKSKGKTQKSKGKSKRPVGFALCF
jgi:hypothetical protein